MEILKTRDQIETKDKWAIDKIYINSSEWEKDFDFFKKESEKIKVFEGKLGDINSLKEYLNLNETLSKILGKLYCYANMRSHEDTSNTEFQGLSSKIESFNAKYSGYTSFFVPEILEKNEKSFMKMINSDEELKGYSFIFESLFKEKPHVLSKAVEEVLANASDCLNASENIYEVLTNAELVLDKIKNENGEEFELTEGSYGVYIRDKDRILRENAFKSLFTGYKKFENTIATSLTSSLKSFVFEAKTRKYKNSLEASLKPNNIPIEVYHNAVDTINKNLNLLHRYVELKKKLLGLDELHMYDLYVPVVDIEKEHIEFNDGIKIVKNALAVLGDEYISIFTEGINNRWIDIYENKGKRSGAYSWGSYETMPYVLLNYNYDLNDVSTLAHEMGHSIHSYYTRKTQPYRYGDYSLFSAEIASTTNEILLVNHLIENEKDSTKKLYIINHELEQIRATVFRQLMFAEFELITHEKIEDGEALTAKEYNEIWLMLNKKYFGNEIIIDEEIASEWARIPHFYSDFYVYQYATGYSAAAAFASKILSEGDNAVEKYKGFLKAGSSKYPIDAIYDAGVDMRTPKPIEETLKRFETLLDKLEELI